MVLVAAAALIVGCAPTGTLPAALPAATATASAPATATTAPLPSPTVAPQATAAPLPSPTAALAAASALPDAVQRIVELTNQNRAEAGCPPVSLDPRLTQAAEQHSRRMAQDDFFAHVGPDGSSPADRVLAAGYDFVLVGENIAAGYASPEAVVESWMESEEHRENILNCEFEEIGVGHVYVEQDPGQEEWHHYWTQVLGTSMSTQ